MSPMQRHLVALIGAASAACGGVIGTVMIVTAHGWGWLILGLAISFGLAAAASRAGPARGALGMVLAYTFGFVLLLWPVVMLAAVLVAGPVPGD